MLQQYDTRNDNIKIYVNGELLDRDKAKISVFDSSVQGGDAVWEGIRVYSEGIFMLDHHLKRLQESAHALMFEKVPSGEEIRSAIFETLRANDMFFDTHIRLTLTRGEKLTSGMDPRLNTKGCGLIVLAEFKPPVYDKNGIRVISSTIRRNNPQFLDSKIHHNNLLNNIQAKIQANMAGVDDALMLDQNGFVSELNGTNLFGISGGKVFTPTADSCLPGITRQLVIDICREQNIGLTERNVSLTEMYTADSVFTCGTMGELVPVIEIDGRKSGSSDSDIYHKIERRFHELKESLCTKIT